MRWYKTSLGSPSLGIWGATVPCNVPFSVNEAWCAGQCIEQQHWFKRTASPCCPSSHSSRFIHIKSAQGTSTMAGRLELCKPSHLASLSSWLGALSVFLWFYWLLLLLAARALHHLIHWFIGGCWAQEFMYKPWGTCRPESMASGQHQSEPKEGASCNWSLEWSPSHTKAAGWTSAHLKVPDISAASLITMGSVL